MNSTARNLSLEQVRELEALQATEWALSKIKGDPLWWLRNYTRTFDQQWQEAGLTGAYNAFPDYGYLDVVFDFLTRSPKVIETHNTKVRIIPKARKLLLSWAVMGKLVHLAQTKEQQEIVIQSEIETKGIYLVKYAKMLWQNQPEWVREAFPLKRGFKMDDFPMDYFELGNGSSILAIPQGEVKLNTMHPSVHFMDEAAFHEEGRGAYNSSVAASSFIILVSSAHPGWFHEIVGEDRYPRAAKQLMEGVAFTETQRGLPVLWIHHTAHPDRKTQDWRDREETLYTSKAEFLRQQDIDFTAGGGEKVLRERLESRWDEIVISDPEWRPHSEWSYDAGLDYGKTHRTAFEVLAKDYDGVLYSIQEHYQAGLDPGEINEIIRRMRIPCASEPLTISKIRHTMSDPSLFPQNIAGEDRFTSIQQLLEKNGTLKMSKALRGLDLFALDMLLEMWPKKGPIRYKIWCPKPITKQEEGTFQSGCPNLLLELMNLRRKEVSATLQQKKGDPEGLVDTQNDAWDALKYFLTSGSTGLPRYSKEEKWAARKEELMEANPQMNLDSLIIYRGKFEREQAKTEELRWR